MTVIFAVPRIDALSHPTDSAAARLATLIFSVLFVGCADAHAHATKAAAKNTAIAPAKAKTVSDGTVTLKDMVITADDGRGKNLLGITSSASQGEIIQAQLQYRPLSRNGELVEVVPGAIATQHSGSGKANQYFLRGFNLDHGTDFTTYIDGVPMNMPSHAHGQGYMDTNSIIPELVKNIDYGKGPYYAELGDFSAAGYAKMFSVDTLPKGQLKLVGGQFDYYRTLIADSHKVGQGNLLYAGEFNTYNGVWQLPEDAKKINGMLRYTLNKGGWGSSLNAKAYTNKWMATNQIPQTAIDNGVLGVYGNMDASDGGNTDRYSFSGNLWNKSDAWKNDINVYTLYYDVNLYSNFTGYLNNAINGDQIHQFEHRIQSGGNIEHTRYNKLLGFDMDNVFGLQFRHDDIINLGLDHTVNRQYLSTVSHDNVSESLVGAYFKNQTYWHDKIRSIVGLRGDFINNDVTVQDTATHNPIINAANSGNRSQMLVSPKLSLIVGPWYNTEYFINAGYGYHSNDARGTTLQLDPNTGAALDSGASRIKPLAWSRGVEIGIRSQFFQPLHSTVALWWLESSQELVFTGDTGTTEVNGKSYRYGIEWSNYCKPNDWLTLDADFAFTSAHYASLPDAAANSYIPNSVGRVISAGATAVAPNGIFTTLRLRHFGDVPLASSGLFWAGNTSIVNLAAGYQQKHYKLEVDIFNILGVAANDIAYAYQYVYPQGTSAQTGILKHPIEPRALRATLTLNF